MDAEAAGHEAVAELMQNHAREEHHDEGHAPKQAGPTIEPPALPRHVGQQQQETPVERELNPADAEQVD